MIFFLLFGVKRFWLMCNWSNSVDHLHITLETIAECLDIKKLYKNVIPVSCISKKIKPILHGQYYLTKNDTRLARTRPLALHFLLLIASILKK